MRLGTSDIDYVNEPEEGPEEELRPINISNNNSNSSIEELNVLYFSTMKAGSKRKLIAGKVKLLEIPKGFSIL